MKYKLSETLIYLKDVSAGYDGKVILQDINITELNVEFVDTEQVTGQTIAILGASGRGKSTLFKILSGLLKPMSGVVLMNNMADNIPNTSKEIHAGDISLVDQKCTLFRHKTVFESLMFALRKDKQTKEEKEALINKYLTQWDLLSQKSHYPCELSGGQEQRVAYLEKALTNNTFLILDEPISGLDVKSIRNVKDSMNKFKSMHEMNTIIFSTHDIRFAVEMADVVYVLGHPTPESVISTIVSKIDLKERGLAWQEFGIKHLELVTEIEDIIINS